MVKYTQFANESMEQIGATSSNGTTGQESSEVVVIEKNHQLNSSAFDQPSEQITRQVHVMLKRIVEHLGFRIFSFSLIIIDISVLIADLSQPNKPKHVENAYDIVALCFVSFFVIEVLFRMYAQGTGEFLKHWYNAVDFVVVMLSFVATVAYVSVEISGYYKLLVIGRVVRIVSLLRIYTEKKNLTKGARLMVSENKRRYRQDGFDLDLVYVTDRIIAMSYPSSGKMSWYRNPIHAMERFFNTKHPNHYRIYNMCSERTYDNSHFNGCIERYLIDDHNVPLLRDATEFVARAQAFLNEDPENVVAVHCKGGKGRTGTMICMLLIHNGLFESAQSRYVEYFQEVKEKHNGVVPDEIPLKVKEIRIYKLSGKSMVHYRSEADVLEVSPINFPVVKGDVKFKFSCQSPSVPRGYEDCPFYFWFHTSFIKDNKLLLPRDVLDNPHKEKTWKVYDIDFAIELIFTNPS
ncbi:hypothetical protein HPB50_013378 [Hyalomma asiaticum]|uniref:Uncharacterized protein n=1 Tax=Hyalomma asiaticum TaxID=266040 RepID=A0ACB7SQA5_HYAAI|nr:hypothetical protein HPB50_013378 [Hyalomma asiaticum]